MFFIFDSSYNFLESPKILKVHISRKKWEFYVVDCFTSFYSGLQNP